MVNYLLKSEKSWDLLLVGFSCCVLKVQYSGCAGLMLVPGNVFPLYVLNTCCDQDVRLKYREVSC